MKTAAFAIACLLAVGPIAAMSSHGWEGQIEAKQLQASGHGRVQGPLTLALHEDNTQGRPLGFSLDAAHLRLEMDRTDLRTSGTVFAHTPPSTNTTFHDSATATFSGNRTMHQWILLPGPDGAQLFLDDRLCFTVDAARNEQVQRGMKADTVNRNLLSVDASRSLQWHDCSMDATATVTGDFLLILWEIDFHLESDQTSESVWTGRQSITPGTDTRTIAAPAQQAFLYVQDGRLTLPLAGAEVFLDSPRIQVRGSLSFQEATGSLTDGVLTQDVQADALVLHGELGLDAYNAEGRLAMGLEGNILEGDADGNPILANMAPETNVGSPWFKGLAWAGLAALGLVAWRMAWRRLRSRILLQAALATPRGDPTRATEMCNDAIQYNKRNGMAYYVRSKQRAGAGDTERALMDCHAAHRYLPRSHPRQAKNAQQALLLCQLLGRNQEIPYWTRLTGKPPAPTPMGGPGYA